MFLQTQNHQLQVIAKIFFKEKEGSWARALQCVMEVRRVDIKPRSVHGSA